MALHIRISWQLLCRQTHFLKIVILIRGKLVHLSIFIERFVAVCHSFPQSWWKVVDNASRTTYSGRYVMRNTSSHKVPSACHQLCLRLMFLALNLISLLANCTRSYAFWFQIPAGCDPWSRPFSDLWSVIPYTSLRPWKMQRSPWDYPHFI